MQKRVKIIHVLHAVGGVDVYLRLLLRFVDPNRFEFIIIHGNQDTKQPYFDKLGNQINEYFIPIQREISVKEDVSSIRQLRRILKDTNPDIIHSHSAKGGIIARSAAYGLGIKQFYTPHAFSYLSSEGKFKKFVFLQIERIFKHTDNFVLATSDSEKNRAIHEVGYKSDRVIVYQNSVEPIAEEIFKKISFNIPENYICSIGRPSFQKNIESMVKVFAQVKKKIPDLSFVLMGVGFHAPNEPTVKELIAKFQLENSFIMLPWVDREEVFPIVKKAKLYISTSRYEGLPYSIIESLALGKACVVSDCDGNKDLVHDEVNGKVYAQSKIEEKMVEGIIELIQDENKRMLFEKNALELFEKNYNIEKTIGDLESIYLGSSTV